MGYKRYTYVNLWRNIADVPIENDHLAMGDERTTVKLDDYIQKDLFLDGGITVVQNSLNARHADLHQWYYFTEMDKDEAILFKQMDSDWTKTGRNCFHMSANDPNIENYAPRESIEVRAICYWKNNTENNDGGINSMPTKENTNADLIKDPLQVAEDMGCKSNDDDESLFERIYNYFFPKNKRKKTTTNEYSGKPEDYLNQFVEVVKYFPSWPKEAQVWVKGIMKDHKNNPDDGIAAITKVLVDDDGNYQNTKTFTSKEKKEIVDYLLSNETYMEAARKQFGSVIANESTQNNNNNSGGKNLEEAIW